MSIDLQPMHHSFTDALYDPDLLSTDQKKALWEKAYRKVKALHSLGTAHQDIKPDNILIKSKWNAAGELVPLDMSNPDLLLVDFGASRSIKDWTVA